MRKLLLPLLTFICMVGYGQSISLAIGPCFSNLVSKRISKNGFTVDSFGISNNYSAKAGYSFGLASTFSIKTGRFSIEPQLKFQALGAKYDLRESLQVGLPNNVVYIQNPNRTLHLDYISVPLMMKFNAIRKLSLDLGTSFGYLLGYRGSPFGKGLEKKFDFGLLSGSTIRIIEKLSTSISFYYGLSKVETVELKSYGEEFSKNIYLGVTVNYQVVKASNNR